MMKMTSSSTWPMKISLKAITKVMTSVVRYIQLEMYLEEWNMDLIYSHADQKANA